MKKMSYLDRLLEKTEPVSESGCLIWLGAVDSAGYGRMKFGPHVDGAHRVAYQLFVGKIPDGLFVCHRCDVKLCVRPDHLFIGTNSDNIKDLIQKGGFRHLRATCENHAKAKLSWKDVNAIRREYSKGHISQIELAKKFNICQSAISSIILHRTWKRQQQPVGTDQIHH